MTTFSDLTKRLSKFTADNSPTILTSVAVIGTITTAVLTGKASIRASQLINLKENTEGVILDPRDRAKEHVGLVWREFIPPVAIGALTITCIIGANRIGSRRTAALASAFAVTEKAFEEYRTKVVEKLGDKKEQEVRDDIAQDRVNSTSISNNAVIITGSRTLFLDSYSGRYFESSIEEVKAAQNAVNHTIIHDNYASLNDFYNKVGLSTTVSGDEVGWNLDRMIEVTFSAAIAEDNRPCIVLDFHVTPIRGYHRIN